MGVRNVPVIVKVKGEAITLGDLRAFVEAAALHDEAALVRVKLVPFKDMANVDGQPVKSLTIETP